MSSVNVSSLDKIRFSYASFVRYSIGCQLDHEQDRKYIIPAGNYNDKTDGCFVEISVNTQTKEVKHVSFENKKFANLESMGLDSESFAQSYLVRNNKYIVVFFKDRHYNVYDIENDKWLLRSYEKGLFLNNTYHSRSVMINDQILIISKSNQLYFYSVAYDHLTNPTLLHEYELKTKNVFFERHGMCCIDYKQEKSAKKLSYYVKILLFGGYQNKDVLSSFVLCDIVLSSDPDSLSLDDNDWHDQMICEKISIKEQLIDKNLFKLKNVNIEKHEKWKWMDFGYKCLVNSKNETVIMIVGDYRQLEKSVYTHVQDTWKDNIILYNCVTHEIICKSEV